MTHLLPPNLLKLFAPRPPLPYLKPLGRDIDQPLDKPIAGVIALLNRIRIEQAEAGEEAEEEERKKNPEAFTLCEEEAMKERRKLKLKTREENMKKALEECERSVS
jgi:U1 small nuclear ribonucleoprotein 70kDa